MINLRIKGRLGNQMFQYATALSLKKELEEKSKIKIDFRKVYECGFKNELKQFNITMAEETNKLSLTLFQKFLILRYKMLLKVNPKKAEKAKKVNMKYGLIYQEYGYQKIISKSRKIFLSGFFESPKYFDNIKGELIQQFTPKEKPLEKNKFLYDLIDKSESICVTIRRGDFLSEKYKSKFYVCTPKYFEEAVNLIKTKVKNPKFFIFSDDIEWCKNNLKFLPKDSIYEDGTDPVYEKLRLMYSCKHFIISNSTFSWWAQFLSRNDNKIVIAPNRWYNIGDNKDIYMDNWILLDVNKN